MLTLWCWWGMGFPIHCKVPHPVTPPLHACVLILILSGTFNMIMFAYTTFMPRYSTFHIHDTYLSLWWKEVISTYSLVMFYLQDGWSPLYTASLNGHIDVVESLIAAGANVNEATKVRTVYMQTCTSILWLLCCYGLDIIQFSITADVDWKCVCVGVKLIKSLQCTCGHVCTCL